MIEIYRIKAVALQILGECKIVSKDKSLYLSYYLKDSYIRQAKSRKSTVSSNGAAWSVLFVKHSYTFGKLVKVERMKILWQLGRQITNLGQNIWSGKDILKVGEKGIQSDEILANKTSRTFEPRDKFGIKRSDKEKKQDICVQQYPSRAMLLYQTMHVVSHECP